MKQEFTCSIKSIPFNENYHPSDDTRLTTNFANLARGEQRQENLRKAFNMINNRFNDLASWDNPDRNRYSVEIDIVSIAIDFAGKYHDFPMIEFLNTSVIDHATEARIDGVLGNSFSSYIRDYDFSVLLVEHNKNKEKFSVPEDFGILHGNLFKRCLRSTTYQQQFKKAPIICLSVAGTRTYHRTTNEHPILGVEYKQDAYSLTDAYFNKMGLRVRYFMPAGSRAPFAFYFSGDLVNDYTNLELISTISTMETFQKIYRPEIYNANSTAGEVYQPSLNYQDYSLTQVDYDREERRQLATEQGKFTESHFIKPFQSVLNTWSEEIAA